jgi:Dolichyl-phosphate-mannose-protein mannosyltransferase
MVSNDAPRDASPASLQRLGNQTRLIYILMAILVLYAVGRSVIAAEGKGLWYDEILTLTVSSLKSPQSMMIPLRRAIDSQPPLFYMIEHFASGLVRNQEIALRLPSIVAFPCTMVCVFVSVKRRSGEVLGLVCAASLLMTDVFQYYAQEARAYSMLVACIAFALVCYQRVPAVRWTVLLALSLVLAESLHHMAVLAMVPFGLAELAFSLRTRKIRWLVWVALVIGALPLTAFWKLLTSVKAYYGSHFYAYSPFTTIPGMYGGFLTTDSKIGAGIVAVALVGILAGASFRIPEGSSDNGKQGQNTAERILLFGLTALPFIGYWLIQSVAHSGLMPRYVLAAVVGIVVSFGYILFEAKLRAILLFAVFVFAAVGVHELHFWRFYRSNIEVVRTHGTMTERVLWNADHGDVPIVVPDGMVLLPLIHYVSPSVSSRFVYIPQEHSADEKNWSDTVDKIFQGLKDYVPMQITNYSPFTSKYHTFLVYIEEKDPVESWLTVRLRQEGWSVHTVASDGYRKVYLVGATGAN